MTSFNELKSNDFWMKKIHRCLETMDTNKDGYISRADFEVMVQRYKDLGAPESHLERLKVNNEKLIYAWKVSDPSVKVTIEEAADTYSDFLESAENREQNNKMFDLWFDQVDINADGWISFDEWEKHCKALKINLEDASASFEAMDTNKDGKISKEEFISYHTEYFCTTEDKLRSSILYGPLS